MILSLNKMLRKILLITLIVILLIDFILIFFYLNTYYNINVSLTTKNSGKQFYDPLNIYPKNYRDPKVDLGSSVLPQSKTYAFLGSIVGKPYFDTEINQYVLLIRFSVDDEISHSLVLGDDNNEIPFFVASKGLLPDYEQWEVKKVNEILPLFKENFPIIISILYTSGKDLKVLQELMKCKSGFCLTRLNLQQEFSKNTEMLYNSIKNRKKLVKKLYIGYPTNIIFYD